MAKKATIFALVLCLLLIVKPIGILTNAQAAAEPVDYKGRIVSDGRITAVIDDDQRLWMWGGQFGTKPLQIMDDAAYVTLGGSIQTLVAAIKTDDTLWIWDEWTDVPEEPVMTNVRNVWVASGCWLVLQKDGTLWLCEDTGTVTKEQLMTGVVSAYIKDNEIAALTEDGTVWEWYDYEYKGPVEFQNDMEDAVAVMPTGGMGSYKLLQMKDGSLMLGRTTHIEDAASYDVSSGRVVVVKTDNTLWEWTSREGEVTQTMTDVAAASTSSEHTAIIKTDGTLWLAGDKEWGLSGLGYNREWSPPEQVMEDVIYADAFHTSFTGSPEACNLILAVKSDGSIWAWGNNASRQIPNDGAYNVGDVYNNYVSTPHEVKGISMFGSTASENTAVEDTEREEREAEQEKIVNEEDVKDHVDSKNNTGQKAEVPVNTDALKNTKKSSAASIIAGIAVLAAAVAGGAVLSKKWKSS
jgi:alpha-tubulin suppressor-like RCC1 family protein